MIGYTTEEIELAIMKSLEPLKTEGDVRTLKPCGLNISDMHRRAMGNFPAIFVCYHGSSYAKIGYPDMMQRQRWNITIFLRDLRDGMFSRDRSLLRNILDILHNNDLGLNIQPLTVSEEGIVEDTQDMYAYEIEFTLGVCLRGGN